MKLNARLPLCLCFYSLINFKTGEIHQLLIYNTKSAESERSVTRRPQMDSSSRIMFDIDRVCYFYYSKPPTF